MSSVSSTVCLFFFFIYDLFKGKSISFCFDSNVENENGSCSMKHSLHRLTRLHTLPFAAKDYVEALDGSVIRRGDLRTSGDGDSLG